MLLSTFSPLFIPPNTTGTSGQLVAKSAGLVLQRLTTPEGVFGGLICTISVKELEDGRILPHEEILPERFENIATSLREDMLMSEPILLGYPRHAKIAGLLQGWIETQSPDIHRSLGSTTDEYWHVADEETISSVLSSFTEVDHLYVADGHHRLGAVKHLFDSGVLASPYFLAACYSFKNLKIHAYHRAVRATPLQREDLFDKLAQLGSLQHIKASSVPSHPTELIIQHGEKWFRWQAALEETSGDVSAVLPASVFEDIVLEKACKITNVKSSHRITYYPDNKQDAMEEFISKTPDQIGFYLMPVLPPQFMHFCRHGLMMPPKSTYFTPRMPRDAVYQLFE